MPNIILFILILFFSLSFGGEHIRCGTLRFAENLKNPKKILAKKSCVPENSNEKVEFRKTTNFIIYYTTSGQHAIRYSAYIDSLERYFEQAYDMHKNILGMKKISGARETYYFRQNVPSGLYPIEILDTGYFYDSDPPFGFTLSKGEEIVIENDFLSYDQYCIKHPFTSISTGKDYSVDWDLALKATVFHELYHAFQSTHYNWQVYNTFWMEASATGVEEIGAPDVNDYISYLSSNFRYPGKSMDSSINIDNGLGQYGWATLYLFLYSQIDRRFDSAIWDYFSKYPKDNFAMQLARLADSLDKDAEDLFHEYAKRVFYSGKRANFSPEELFWVDMPKWPDWNINTKVPSVLQPGTIDFIRIANEPSTVSVARKSQMKDGDYPVWVLSRLLEREYVAEALAKKELAAYPNPWNPKTAAIHFKNLPEKSKGIEIRSANGALLTRIKHEEGDSLTLSWEPKKFPAPGILYYRALPYGKNKALIVQY